MAHKKVDKPSTKKTLHHRNSSPNLTQTQTEVLYLLTKDFLTPVQIASRRQTSRQNINQIINKIRKKGYLSTQNYNALRRGGAVTHNESINTAQWRYHKLHFVMTPFFFEPRYDRYRKKYGNYGVEFGDWLFFFHKEIIEVRLKQFVDFCSVSKWESLRKAERSFNKYVTMASNKYGFRVFKDSKANVRIVDQHLACNGSDLSKAERKDNYVSIKGYDDKIWFLLDKSKGDEHEYVHSDLAVSDSEKLEPYLNSLRYREYYLPHEVKNIIDIIIGVQHDYAIHIKKHLKVQDVTLNTMQQMQKTLSKMEKKM